MVENEVNICLVPDLVNNGFNGGIVEGKAHFSCLCKDL